MKRLMGLCFAAMMMAAPVSAYAQNAQEIMERFSHEPTIEATMDAAIEYSGLSSDRLEGLYRRAGGANALPKKVAYEFQIRDRVTDKPQKVFTYETSEAQPSIKSTIYREEQDYLQHKVNAEWDLSKLVYNSEQRGVVNMMSQVVQKRDKMLKDLTKVYYARRKAQIEMLVNPPSSVTDKLDSELKIQELTANLDAMTGGWFSEQIKNGRH